MGRGPIINKAEAPHIKDPYRRMAVFDVLTGLFTGAVRPTARVPEGLRVYAIGDIHGRVDLLRHLHRRILDDAARAPAGTRFTAVYLGDYVDRGEHSREVIDLLLDRPLEGFEAVYLKGNHDHSFLTFLDDESVGPGWFVYGGDATIRSYGASAPASMPLNQRLAYVQQALRRTVPEPHRVFLERLQLSRSIGDYLFVHAGIRPGCPLDEQAPEDLLWIRDEFLASRADHGKVVVHGHSMSRRPQVRRNRIGIDTGAYRSDVLTCLVLNGSARRFLDTSDATE